jgi:predicted Na+-dependent transporter
MLVLFIYVLCNYTVGYIGMSAIKGRTWQERVSSLFCCGLRNNGFALIIAITYFNRL